MVIRSFRVARTWPDSEPPESFFGDVQDAAADALRAGATTQQQVWALCEYMDCVDSGCLPFNAAFRALCAEAVARFLWDAPPELIARFNRGSFAAEAQGVTDCFNGQGVRRLHAQL